MHFKRNIKTLYVIRFFQSLIPAYIIERLFWSDRGMNIAMVVAIEIIYSMTITLLEIPSGILADKLGRKKLLVIAGFMDVLEFVILYFSHNFTYFAIAIVLSGIGHACSSGALEALMYESLLADDKQDDYEKIVGRNNVIDSVGSSIAAVSGGILAIKFSFEFNYFLSIISKMLAFILILTLKEPPISKPENNTSLTDIGSYIKGGLSFFRKQPLILNYLLTGVFLGACYNYLDEFWQLLMENVKVPIVLFGFISIGRSILLIPGNLLAFKLKKKLSYRDIFIRSLFVYGIMFLGIGIISNGYVLVAIMVLALLSGVLEPLLDGCIHHNVDSDIRATVQSFVSLFQRAIIIVVGFIFSYFGNIFINRGFIAIGILCLLYFGIESTFSKKKAESTISCKHE